MATAELEKTENSTTPRRKASPAFELDPTQPLGFPCPVIGFTGPKWSGKTLLSLSLAPGLHPAGHRFAGEPRTLTIDFETSTTGYSTGAEKWNAPEMLRQRFGGRALTSVDIFAWFRDSILAIDPGRYDVIVADPVTDAEDGLIDYVRKQPGEFGYTANQFAQSTALLMGAAKNYWKRILVDFTARCKIFAFVAHDRMEFLGGRPTGKKIPKGKETLFELASLYLELAREKVADGERPKPPSARVLKSRFAHTHFSVETGELEIIEILPQRIPIATPAEIRKYVQSPIGLRKTKTGEVVVDAEPTDFERQMLTLEIETQRATAETAKLASAERLSSAAERVQATGGPQFQPPDFSKPVAAAPTQSPQAEFTAEPASPPLPDDQVTAEQSGDNCPFDDGKGDTGAVYDNTLTMHNASRCTEIQRQKLITLFRTMGEATAGTANPFTPDSVRAILANRKISQLSELTIEAAAELAGKLGIALQQLYFDKVLNGSNASASVSANGTASTATAGEDASPN